MTQFLDYLATCVENKDIRPVIDRFLLHGGLLGTAGDEDWETVNMIVSDRTQHILKRLGFQWQEVTANHIGKMIDIISFS